MTEYELARQEHERHCRDAAERRAAKRARAAERTQRHDTGLARDATSALGGSSDAADRSRVFELARIVRHPLTARTRKA